MRHATEQYHICVDLYVGSYYVYVCVCVMCSNYKKVEGCFLFHSANITV